MLTGAVLVTALSAFTVPRHTKVGGEDRCSLEGATDDVATWVPDVGHPVLAGYQDVDEADGAPGDIRIYYPTLDIFPENARIVEQCDSPYPMVLLLHGQPPAGPAPANYHREFHWIATGLARSGYVVVAPEWRARLSPSDTAWSLVAEAAADLWWVRFNWSESQYVDTRIQSTAVVGHSYGALLAARFADMFWDIGAFVSLSGPYRELTNEYSDVLHAVEAPSFYVWANGGGNDENLDWPDSLWDGLSRPRYATVFKGEHFDYLDDTGASPAGPCHPLVGHALADLTTLFIARNLPIGDIDVPVDLTVPHVELTGVQAVYAANHLKALDAIESEDDCSIDMRWDTSGQTGNRHIGP